MASFPLISSPLALLQLLRLRTGGNLPNEFSTEIKGTVDVADMYGADRLLAGEIVGAAGAYPRTAAFVSPFGSAVRLHQVALLLVKGAAGAANNYYSAHIRLQPPGGNPDVPFFQPKLLQSPVALAIGHVFDFGGQLPNPRIIPPGWQLFGSVDSNDAGVADSVVLRFVFENIVV